jgi:hypothetical protein
MTNTVASRELKESWRTYIIYYDRFTFESFRILNGKIELLVDNRKFNKEIFIKYISNKAIGRRRLRLYDGEYTLLGRYLVSGNVNKVKSNIRRLFNLNLVYNQSIMKDVRQCIFYNSDT